MKTIRLLSVVFSALLVFTSCQVSDDEYPKNLAIVAEGSSSIYGQWVLPMNDGEAPARSINWTLNMRMQDPEPQWVEYRWQQPVNTEQIVLNLWDYEDEISLPEQITLSYWDGNNFIPVTSLSRQQMKINENDTIRFDPVETDRLRLEAPLAELLPANILEWEVHQLPGSPDHPPLVDAGVERDVMVGGDTYLSGNVKSVSDNYRVSWSMESGPGRVSFNDRNSLEASASFSEPGDYILKLTASEGRRNESAGTVKVRAHNMPAEPYLQKVRTTPYSIDNPLWSQRIRSLIVTWIPYVIDQLTDPEVRTGGIDNFIEAEKALRGEPHGEHRGLVFSNAYVLQTIESMSLALMVDPQGDQEIIAAQRLMEETLEDWIPKVLAAQEPDGYLQTAYTLRDPEEWEERWEPRQRRAHEGYIAGYFMEAAVAHFMLTEGNDRRLYDAAKRLADCWNENIGPGKKEWYDGHQGIKQALVRFARLIDEVEGEGSGDSYIQLADFLLDNRDGGSQYDQSHVHPVKQYEAVGHAVRAVYSYNATAELAEETGNIDYYSASKSVWNNIVNKKYYLTGGIGSGETSEGFGPNYSLRNNSYCESCASCGMIFFQHTMNSTYHASKYADLYEETLYNALLGSMDLAGERYYYPNPLTERRERITWHNCPCCVGNIPRTLLMIPTWSYQKNDDGLFVNLFIGSTVNVGEVGGTAVEMVQQTDYPWSGDVSLTVNPDSPAEFTLFVRIPDRNTSELYNAVPGVSGYESMMVNGESIQPEMSNGYAVITRRWEAGDRIDISLPMEIQRVTSIDKVEANRGKVAFRYGPLVYNVEAYDNDDIEKQVGLDPLSLEWRGDLLNGVMVIKGQWADGSPLIAIPNYARTQRIDDREGESPVYSRVWMLEE